MTTDEIIEALRARGDALSIEAAARIKSMRPRGSMVSTPASRAEGWAVVQRGLYAAKAGWKGGEAMLPYIRPIDLASIEARQRELEFWLTLFTHKCGAPQR